MRATELTSLLANSWDRSRVICVTPSFGFADVKRDHHSGISFFVWFLEDGINQGVIHRFPAGSICSNWRYFLYILALGLPHNVCVSFRSFARAAPILFVLTGGSGVRVIDSSRSDFDRSPKGLALTCGSNGTVASRGYRDNLSNSRGVAIVDRPISAKKTMKLARNRAVRPPRSTLSTGFGRKRCDGKCRCLRDSDVQ